MCQAITIRKFPGERNLKYINGRGQRTQGNDET